LLSFTARVASQLIAMVQLRAGSAPLASQPDLAAETTDPCDKVALNLSERQLLGLRKLALLTRIRPLTVQADFPSAALLLGRRAPGAFRTILAQKRRSSFRPVRVYAKFPDAIKKNPGCALRRSMIA
jgi:hypothetical protein